MALLTLTNAHLAYGHVALLDGADFALETSERVALIGLDVIGDSVTEINVTSPTCFQEITEQTGFDVPAMFIDALEAHLAA